MNEMVMKDPLTLINRDTNSLLFQISRFDRHTFSERQRLPYYSVIWIQGGTADIQSDFSEHIIQKNHLLFFSPYQSFKITGRDDLVGQVFHFHSDFYCIFEHEREIGCNGVLFFNIYEPNTIKLDQRGQKIFKELFDQINEELTRPGLSQHQMLIAQLKMILIHSVRIKAAQGRLVEDLSKEFREPQILNQLKALIEENFKKKHAPLDYAEMLDITPKSLGKLTRQYFDKTPTQVIAERIVTEAKRALYLTDSPIKTIGYELGFKDEFHFSRYFKTHTGVSPQHFREHVGFNALGRRSSS